MRVTENSNYDSIRDRIFRSREKMEELQRQAASLKKVNQPSDDPIGSSKILELRTDRVNNDQYQMNGKLAEAFLGNTDHALSELSDIIVRAKEIAIGQSNSMSSSDESRIGVAEEITQLFKQAVAVGNRRVGERYLFGGYKTQTPPIDPQGRFQGDDGQLMIEIANNVFISMNVSGQEAFNTRPKAGQSYQNPYFSEDIDEMSEGAENVNLFDELQNFRIGLLTGNIESIRTSLDRFDQIFEKLVATRAKVGARIQGLQFATQAIDRHNVTNATLSSNLEDADMAQVANDLSKEEAVFRSSLASSKRLIQPTLLDFLK